MREGIDELLLPKLGTAIDDRIFAKVLLQIGALDDQVVLSSLGLIRGSIRKITSYAYLVTAPKNGDSLITRARIAHKRQAELRRRPQESRNGHDERRDLDTARKFLEAAARGEVVPDDLKEWAESVVGGCVS